MNKKRMTRKDVADKVIGVLACNGVKHAKWVRGFADDVYPMLVDYLSKKEPGYAMKMEDIDEVIYYGAFCKNYFGYREPEFVIELDYEIYCVMAEFEGVTLEMLAEG